MSSKLSLVILGFVVVLLTTGMNGGCGETVGTSTTYYYPNWMPDGRIIACKDEMTFTRNLWGTGVSGYKTYITALTINDSNEVTNEENLFEIDEVVAEITCSPTGEMIVYITNTPSTRDITIKNYSGQTLYEPASDAEYLDWSPDATKIVYTNSSRELYVVNRDGTNNNMIATSAEAVAWRVGEKIAFVTYTGTQSALTVSVMESNGTNVIHLKTFASDPQILAGTEEVIYSGLGSEVRKIKFDGFGDTLLFSNYERTTLKLSFDNTKIVGGDLITGGGSRIGGIWVTKISDGTSSKIK